MSRENDEAKAVRCSTATMDVTARCSKPWLCSHIPCQGAGSSDHQHIHQTHPGHRITNKTAGQRARMSEHLGRCLKDGISENVRSSRETCYPSNERIMQRSFREAFPERRDCHIIPLGASDNAMGLDLHIRAEFLELLRLATP